VRAVPAARKAGDAGLLPRVHQVVALLTPWMMGTHQGAGSDEHHDRHPDEGTFRVSRRTPRARGKLFCRLVQPEVAVDLVPSDAGHQKKPRRQKSLGLLESSGQP